MCIHVYLTIPRTFFFFFIIITRLSQRSFPLLFSSYYLSQKDLFSTKNHLTLFKTLNTHTGFRVFWKNLSSPFSFCVLGPIGFCPSSQKRRHFTPRRHGNHRRVRQRQVRGRRAGTTTTTLFFCCIGRLSFLGCCRF